MSFKLITSIASQTDKKNRQYSNFHKLYVQKFQMGRRHSGIGWDAEFWSSSNEAELHWLHVKPHNVRARLFSFHPIGTTVSRIQHRTPCSRPMSYRVRHLHGVLSLHCGPFNIARFREWSDVFSFRWRVRALFISMCFWLFVIFLVEGISLNCESIQS